MVQHWNVCTIVFWRVVWYCAGAFLCMRSWQRRVCGCVAPVAAVAVAVVPWTSWLWRPSRPGRGRVMAVVWLWCRYLCRRRVVATRR